MRCACESLFQLTGNEADEYSREHLTEVEVDAVNWTVQYVCPETSRRWLRDSPQAELQGGGPPRLRQIDTAGKPVTATSRDPFR